MNDETDKRIVPVRYGPSRAVVPLKEGNQEIKSVTEVKHGTVHFLTQFSKLQQDTNLNIPPSNWLRTSSKLEQHVRDLTWRNSRKASEYSSIDMAHNSPDLAGEVDVISNAANIKKLLKIPYEKSHISMMVHRVGKSLLLDEFDIHRHLLRQEQAKWGWLRQFYDEYVLRDLHAKMKCVPRPSKSRDNLQNRNMYSKFLYHSLCHVASQQLMEAVSESDLSRPASDKTVIPDPLPQPMGTQFHRELLWTFEDIKMLIGTDMPVFCDDSYCVSLRLQEMSTPINVLTGLDYWLDNLMCNVPEVAMCFHIDGIVKKYEVIKTEDIPHLADSKFDPCVVTDIAKNILSFLKNNATKEGHTYWLYKGTHDDVVKLYDLTALCGDDNQHMSEENPFTVPLGMLLYRVARNMWTSRTPGKASLIRTLLESCLYLLDENKHSQVCTSASYLLSDIYVPDSSLEDDWTLPSNSSSDNSDEESGQEWEDTANEKTTSVDVEALHTNGSVNRTKDLARLKPFNETVEERCQESLKYIHSGLMCLDNDLNSHKSRNVVEEQLKCNSDEAIPLHYEPLNTSDINNDLSGSSNSKHSNSSSECNKNSSSSSSSKNRSGIKSSDNNNSSKKRSKSETVESRVTSEKEKKQQILNKSNAKLTDIIQMTPNKVDAKVQGQSWHQLSKGLLFRKAAFIFTAMAKSFIAKEEYLAAFKCVRSAFYCFDAMQVILPHKGKENATILSCLYGLSGDIRLVLIKSTMSDLDWDKMGSDSTSEETSILEMAEKELEICEFEWTWQRGTDMESNLRTCVLCYTKSVDLIYKRNKAKCVTAGKRKGNALNELGVWCMHQAQSLLQSGEIGSLPSEEIEYLWRNSKDALLQGIETFEAAGDVANQVLLHCNIGRLMRLCAQTYTHISVKGEKQEFTPVERYYFNMAIDYYKKALILGEQGFKSVHDSIVWELSTTYFNMATLLQDYAPLSSVNKGEVEKEIVTLMNKSLKYCKTEVGNASQPMYQYRAATIHHRLASLFHSTVRGNCSDQKKKHLRHLCESHYNQAVKLFRVMECHTEGLQVQLEYVALLEYCLTLQGNPGSRLRLVLQMLHCLTDCQESLKGFIVLLDDKEYETNLQGEGETITKIMESRLQFVLLQLMKAYSIVTSKKSKEKLCLVDELKVLYAKSIQRTSVGKTEDALRDRCLFLQGILEQSYIFYQRMQTVEQDLNVT